MKNTLTILPLLVLLSCTDIGVNGRPIDDPEFEVPNNSSVDEARNLIVGEWDWYKSISAWAPPGKSPIHTPETEGYTKRIIFQSRGTAQLFRNDTLEYEGMYTVTEYSPKYYELSINGYSHYYGLRVSNDYLGTDNRPVDGPAEYYVRRK